MNTILAELEQKAQNIRMATMNITLIRLLERINSIDPKVLTPEQKVLLNELEVQIQLRLLRDNRIKEKDDHFWTDLSKTFLGI